MTAPDTLAFRITIYSEFTSKPDEAGQGFYSLPKRCELAFDPPPALLSETFWENNAFTPKAAQIMTIMLAQAMAVVKADLGLVSSMAQKFTERGTPFISNEENTTQNIREMLQSLEEAEQKKAHVQEFVTYLCQELVTVGAHDGQINIIKERAEKWTQNH